DIRILFLGGGANRQALMDRAAREQLKNVLFIDSVPKAEVVRYWSILDASIIHLRKTDLFTTVIPSKLFECMAMGIPVLHGVRGESAEIVEREGAGLTFEPENALELKVRLTGLADGGEQATELGRHGLAAAIKYDRKHLAG